MREVFAIFAALALWATAPWPTQAHSIDEVDAQLGHREKYFQALDRPAPVFELKDAEGRRVSLGDLHGKVIVLHFIYTHCPDVCPLHAEKVAEVQRMVNQTAMRDRVRFITITTDPERDTSDVIREYGATHGLDPANWSFLTSGPDRPDETRKLAQAFGHSFTPTQDGMQMHGIVTHVIDREGRLRANFHGLQFEPINLVTFVNALTEDHQHPGAPPSQPFWDRLKQFFRRAA